MPVMRAPYAPPPIAASPSSGSVLQLPPHLYPPPGAQSKNLVGYVPVPAPGDPAAVILAFTVPVSMRLIINQLGNNFVGAGFTEGSGELTWQIWDNGVPIEDFDNIPGSLGNVALPTPIAPIEIDESHTISFVIINNTGSGIPANSAQIGATLRGWYYNKLDAGYGEWTV
jgi:hypothetical protein